MKRANDINPILFEIQEVGKRVQSSKKRYTWTFSLKEKIHQLVFDFSYISGKAKIMIDNRKIVQTQTPNESFQYSWSFEGFNLHILQQEETFELRINNKPFSHLLNQVRTANEFSNEEDQVKDIKVDEGMFDGASKKMKLSIGGMSSMKKKPKKALQSQDWKKIGGSTISFPSFFAKTSDSQPKLETKQSNKKIVQSNLLDEFLPEPPKPKQEKQEKKYELIDFFSLPLMGKTSTEEKQKTPEKNTTGLEKIQNLFGSPTNQSMTRKRSSIDFFESVQKETVKEEEQKTVESQKQFIDFNTMQQLFATNMNNIMQKSNSSSEKTSASSNILFPNASTVNYENFNEMQSVFTTQNKVQQKSNENIDPFAILEESIKQSLAKVQTTEPKKENSPEKKNIQNEDLLL